MEKCCIPTRCQKVNYEKKNKQWWSTFSPISTKQTITSHLKSLNTKKRPWQSILLLVGLRVRIMCLSSMFSPRNENLNLLLWIKFFILFLYSSFKKNWKNGPKTKFYWFCAGGLVLIVRTECLSELLFQWATCIKNNQACWSSTKDISLYYQKVFCSLYVMAENLLTWR